MKNLANICCQNKKIWINAAIEYNVGLNKWLDNDDLNKFLRKPSTLGLKGRLNWALNKRFGAFGEIFISKSFYYDEPHNHLNLLNEFNLTDYYIKDQHSHIEKEDIGGGIAFGLFHKTRYKKWDLIPSLGFIREQIGVPNLNYTIKQIGSNNMYKVHYYWFSKKQVESYKYMNILSFQLMGSYPLVKNLRLNIGLNYKYYITKPSFEIEISDYYSSKPIKNIKLKGNHMKALGINAGLTF